MIGSPTEEIKSRLDIVEFIRSYVRLEKAGVNFRAPCPFHAEKTPSFFVSPARQIWHCFGGCGEGGDIFKFAMKLEGMDFPEALRLLAARAGVELKREDSRMASERARLYGACEEAAKIYEKKLLLTAEPKEYLKKRGVAEGTVRGFRIGWAPESWDFLTGALVKKGFKLEEIERAGLAIRSEDGRRRYDRFRSRIIFPINDANGRVIGFGGRIFRSAPDIVRAQQHVTSGTSEIGEEHVAKYINTPQTMIYDKSRALYGFDRAKQEIRTAGRAVVVEGYMDCVMSHQAGVKNAVAVSGTALTAPQLKIIKRLSDSLIFSFDTDAAGESATKRSLSLAAEFEFERRIAAIPSGKDPADAVLENPGQWIAAVAGARPVIDFYFEKTFREINPEMAEGKKKISGVLVPLISALPGEIEKAHWVRELAKRFAIGEDAVWKEVARRPADSGAGTAADDSGSAGTAAVRSRRELLEDRFLSLMATVPESAKAREFRLAFSLPAHQEIFTALLPGAGSMPPHVADAVGALRFKGEIVREMGRDAEQEFLLCLRELEKACVRDELSRMGEEMQKRERAGDEEGMRPLLENFRAVSEKLKSFD